MTILEVNSGRRIEAQICAARSFFVPASSPCLGSHEFRDRTRSSKRLASTICAAVLLFGGVAEAADTSPPRAPPIAAFVDQASARFGIPASWITAVMRVESGGQTRAVSPKGAMGLMQIMPRTWAALRARYGLGADPLDPRDNISAGVAYLRELFDHYGSPGFLTAYNAGPGRYEGHLASGRQLPAETISYVARIANVLSGDGRAITTNKPAVVHPWTESPVFSARSTPVPASLETASKGHPRSASRSLSNALLTVLSPRSDGLFVAGAMRTAAQ